MSEKCEKCGAQLVEGGIISMQGVFFYPNGEESKLKPKRSAILCSCCTKCGNLQNFRAAEPEKVS